MLINDYFQEIRNLIEACPIIQSYNLTSDSRSLYVGFIRGDLNLADRTLLHIREFVNVRTGIARGKYTYQYMSASNNLIFRYDNAPHHQELNLPNYPHHKHIRSEENIISSDAPLLADVPWWCRKLLNSLLVESSDHFCEFVGTREVHLSDLVQLQLTWNPIFSLRKSMNFYPPKPCWTCDTRVFCTTKADVLKEIEETR